ncbi:ketopantoate reductase family protein [Pseudohalioglobus lutimaris]|uniref:2-dehydropantoate 2-reductase n=1 Tax=Pseudohalioglobus lutimaris TaxID=1737061 RepID=A0A2N5X792_9GAMM|nr:2-dehydropantoate 2-reductase [Pseudohalioglobus lutimaris]PLW70347.1 hypothetical protein C0039_03845 [Pseudohalioglobus lutimaris]
MSAHHWHVLGAGAMGCLFGQQLMAAGCTVTLLQRSAPKKNTGTLCVEAEGIHRHFPVQVAAADAAGDVDLLLVATKAPDIANALFAMRHRLRTSTDIVIAANGMGFVAAVEAMLPENRLFCCTTTEGAYRVQPLHIHHAGRGLTRIGSLDGGGPPAWFEAWLDTPLHCQWEQDINAVRWEKLAVNCAINPLTAINRCKNGTLATSETLREQVTRLCDEIAAVSSARGNTHTASIVHAAVAEVIAGTATNRSSMLQDIEAGRPTEIDFITGYLIAEAARLGVDVPANQALLNEVKALDQ